MDKTGRQKVSGRGLAKYALTPGITPEIRRLGHSLGHFAHLLALIFARAGIFKTNHPYVNPANIGRFGVGDVFGAAAQSVRLDRKHFPQAAIYLATISLVVLMSIQVALTVVTIGVGEARAAAAPVFTCSGADCDPVNDLALNYLGDIFGTYDFISDGAMTLTPTPVHQGLWTLLAYYSNALLIVATFIVLYYVISAVGETAVYGTPFGRRFNSVWAPLRLVTAIGLLVPLPMAGLGGPGVGLNSGQYIVLFAAKSGSNLASNALSVFTTAVSTASYAESFISQPNMPNVDQLVAATWTWALCSAAVHKAGISRTLNLVDSELNSGADSFSRTGPNYLSFWVKSDSTDEGWERIGTSPNHDSNTTVAALINSTPVLPPGADIIDHYATTFEDVKVGDILVAMGPPGMPEYCGVLKMPQNFMADVNEARDTQLDPTSGEVAGKFQYAHEIRDFYMDLPRRLLAGENPGPSMLEAANGISCMMMSQGCTPAQFGNPTLMPDRSVPDQWVTWTRNELVQLLASPAAVADRENYATLNAINMNNGYVDSKGWAAAALYWNEIMRANQVLHSAAGSIPDITDAPVPLEHFQQENPTLAEGNVSGSGMQGANGFELGLLPGSLEMGQGAANPGAPIKQATSHTSVQENSSNVEASFDYEMGQVIGAGLWWYNAAPNPEKQAQAGDDGGAMGGCFSGDVTWQNCIRTIVGIQGFYDLEGADPREVNPLVIMQNIGHQLVTRAGIVVIAAAGLGIASAPLGNALFAIAGLAFGIGAFLGFMLPLMPFLYFFFGVVQWGFSVFEAVVAAPLWALSHLRIDGEGLPGPAAMNGYYLIFEIFLRPMLLLFGLIAAAVTFTAATWMLHQTWATLTGPMEGATIVGFADSFVFTLIYTLVVYMVANSSFKLITMIPQAILRWMGQGGATPLTDMFQGTDQMLQRGGMGVGALGSVGLTNMARAGNRDRSKGKGGGGGASPKDKSK